MQYKSAKGQTGATQLGLLLLFTGVGLILAVIFQLVITFSLLPAGTSLSNLESALKTVMQNPKHVQAIRLMQIASTLLMICLPAMVYSWFCHGKKMHWLGFNKQFSIFQILIGFLLIFAANLVAGSFQEISTHLTKLVPSLDKLASNLEKTYSESVEIISNLQGTGDLIMAIFIMAFLPALFEEMFFRGALQNILTRWWQKPYAAIIVSSILFSLIHFSIWLFLSRFILGMMLGVMFYTTRNIWVNTIAHFLNNLIAVVQMYVLHLNQSKVDVSKLDTPVEWYVSLLAGAMLIFLVLLLKRYSQKHVHQIDAQEMRLYMEEQRKHHPF